MEHKRIVQTGIRTLDLLLGGGIPARQSIIVTGDPGTGKTILCSQIAFAHASRGERVVMATVASESHDKLMDELQGFSFFDPERIGNEIYVVSAYPWLQKGPKDAKDLLLKSVKERKAKLLFIDGLRSLRDLWQNEAKLRDFLYEINVGLAQLEAVGLFTTEYPLHKLMDYPEATTVDGIISLTALRFGGRIGRRAQVAKLRGRAHLTGEHLMHITADGIHLVPRMEETVSPDPHFKPKRERAEFGLPELDNLLMGGLPSQSTTLLVGSTGVGKTLLALHFAATGAQKGEPTLMVNYNEPIVRLVSRAKAVSLDVEPLLGEGQLLLEYRSPTNVEADDLIEEIVQKVESMQIRRVVIDGLGDLENGVLEKDRMRGLLNALIIKLRDLGATTIFVKEVAKIASPDLDFSDTPVSVTAENVLFFRHIELRGRIHRVASVLKMRESSYDPYVREFEITEHGIRVLHPLASAEGLLTGIGRVVESPKEIPRP